MKRRSAPNRAVRQVLVVLWGMVAGALVFTGPAIQHAAAQTLTDAVTVNAMAGLGTIPSDAIGLNTAVYDGYMNDTPIPGLLKAAGFDALRFPGGSYSDIYNWQTNTAQGGYVAPGNRITNAASIPIMVTETNSTIDMDTQPGALFTADMYMTWLENGATNVDYWNEHNGAGTISTVNGVTDYGDQGMLSNASSSSGSTEPAAETPFAPYYGVEMPSKLGSPGDQLVTSTSASALVRVHAVRSAGGSLNVLIDNEDPGNSYTVSLAYNGFTPNGSPTVYTFANNANSITSTTQSSASSVTVPPYSLTVVHIPGSGGTGVTAPGAPGQPAVSGLGSSTSGSNTGTATLSWPASTPGTYPVANYKVYQQGSGGSTTLVGTTSTTSFSLTGLTIGASYTYNVVATDSQGNPSLPSPPVTFTVPPPKNSSCAVHYAVNSSWPGGFSVSVTMTNNGSTAISPWQLTFSFPASGEGVQGGWNGTWSQSGQQVTVNAASWNSTIAANGGTVSIGFNGTDTGQDPVPTAFYINGTVCANN